MNTSDLQLASTQIHILARTCHCLDGLFMVFASFRPVERQYTTSI